MSYIEPSLLNPAGELWVLSVAPEACGERIIPVGPRIDDFAERLGELAAGARAALEQACDGDPYSPDAVRARFLLNVVNRVDADLGDVDPRDPMDSLFN